MYEKQVHHVTVNLPYFPKHLKILRIIVGQYGDAGMRGCFVEIDGLLPPLPLSLEDFMYNVKDAKCLPPLPSNLKRCNIKFERESEYSVVVKKDNNDGKPFKAIITKN